MTPNISRRGCLLGVGALALSAAACSHADERVTESDINEYLSEISVALQQGNLEEVARLFGHEPSPEWSRTSSVMRAAGGSLELVLQQGGLDPLSMSGPTPLRLQALTSLRHRFPADPASVGQPVTLSLRRAREGFLVESASFDRSSATQPWLDEDIDVHRSENLILLVAVGHDLSPAMREDIQAAAREVAGEIPGIPAQQVLAYASPSPVDSKVFAQVRSEFGASWWTPVVAQGGAAAQRVVLGNLAEYPTRVETIARHEFMHALTAPWGSAAGDPFAVEGPAVWVEWGYLAGARAARAQATPDVANFLAMVKNAQAAQLRWPNFYESDISLRYFMSGLFFCWLEEGLGRDTTWQLLQQYYAGTVKASAFAQARGFSSMAEAMVPWGEWVLSFVS